jgi:hypothetical protein
MTEMPSHQIEVVLIGEDNWLRKSWTIRFLGFTSWRPALLPHHFPHGISAT